MTGDGLPRITKLDVENYMQWSIEMEHILRIKGCWAAVDPAGRPANEPVDPTLAATGVGAAGRGSDGTGSAGSAADANAVGAAAAAAAASLAAAVRMEELARSTLALSVKPHHLATFQRHPTARGAWEALANEFRSCGPARVMNLRRELHGIKMGRGESVVRYFNRGKSLAWELGALGVPIDDKQLVASLLLGLGGKFTMTATILTAQPDVTMEHAQETMQAAEARMSLDKGADRREDAGSALALSDGGRPKTQGNRFRKDIRCFKCNKTGHIKRNCRSKDGPGREDHGDSGGAAGLAMMATVLHAGDSWATIAAGQWVVDSGASHHMTGDAGSLTGVQPCTPVQVSLADGRTSTARTRGTASLTVDGPTGTRNLDLGDVLVVPGLAVPLFSVRQASSHGFSVEFCNNHVNIKANGTVQAMGESVGRLYILGTAASSGTAGAAAAATTAVTWHRRSAHLGPNTMARAAAALTGMAVDKTGLDALRVGTYSPCIEGRMTRAPFPSSTSRSTAPLQLLHTDVMGGMPVLSAGGAAYLVTIIDDYTRFKAVIPISTKGLAKDAVIRIANLWENQTDKRVKVVRSDGGKEYTGGAWTGWLRDKGTTH